MCLSYPFWTCEVYSWMLSHDLLWTWYYTCLCLFLTFWWHYFPLFPPWGHMGQWYYCICFYFSKSCFWSFSLLAVKCWLLIGWKNRVFCLVRWLVFIWVCLYNMHPQRFCIGEWIWLRCPFRLGYFLVHFLGFLLACLPDWHPRRYWWGVCFSEYIV